MSQRQYKTMPSSKTHKPGFMVSGNRQAKARKIKMILDEAQGEKTKPTSRQSLLDIGTGNGEIACYLSESYDVTSVDVADQRMQK